jgi:branched-chain amino acid transport system permease protein
MDKFLQLSFAGLAVGVQYALVALGFVIIYKATGIINFAQGSLAHVGAYLTFNASVTWGLPFYVAVLFAVIACGVLGLLVERVLLSRMVGQPVFAVIMITIGLSIVIDQVVIMIWGGGNHPLDDPWQLATFQIGAVTIAKSDAARIVVAAVLLAAFFLFFRFSVLGVAMRATASDQEAALAQGISVRRIVGVTWAVAAGIATMAGVLLASGGRGVDPTLGIIALTAFPAIILGGLDSPGGAVVGGIIMGIVEVMTAGYSDKLPEFLGTNFQRVTPYVVLVLILLIRPYGLFGTKEVQRV